MTYKILCTDGFSKAGLDEFAKSSILETIYVEKLSHEELLARVAGYDGLVVRSASKVSRDVIDAGKNLKIIARAGVGIDNVDLGYATEKGIVVANAPAGNSVSTAELAFSMVLSLARHIPQASKAMGEGRWEKTKFKGTQVAGKTLGVIGLGRIGREVSIRAKAFKMDVLGFDPYLQDAQYESLGVKKASLEDIYRNSDFITIHTPLSPETENLITVKEIKMMKPKARLINCARGGIVKEDDLAVALKEQWIAGAALDVFTEEPFKKDIFNGLENIILTPHLGASTAEAQDAVAVEAAQTVVEFFEDGLSANALNLDLSGKDLDEFGRHIVLAEKIGWFASQLCDGKVNRMALLSNSKLPGIIARAAAKGTLTNRFGETISFVNSLGLAKADGVSVSEEIVADEADFRGEIGVRLSNEGHEVVVWGVVLSDGTPKIVKYGDYRVEIDPVGTMLIIENRDQPGVIGRVSTWLGESGTNIAEMQNVRHKKGEKALTIIRVDGEVSNSMFSKISGDTAIKRARLVHL